LGIEEQSHVAPALHAQRRLWLFQDQLFAQVQLLPSALEDTPKGVEEQRKHALLMMILPATQEQICFTGSHS
jgi:hypothetical protein